MLQNNNNTLNRNRKCVSPFYDLLSEPRPDAGKNEAVLTPESKIRRQLMGLVMEFHDLLYT